MYAYMKGTNGKRKYLFNDTNADNVSNATNADNATQLSIGDM